MTQEPEQPAQLAHRLRELRESHWPGKRLTQAQLAKAFSAESQVASATISAWESPGNVKVPAEVRLEAYARFFSTERSLAGSPHLVRADDLTTAELEGYEELKEELLGLLQTSGINVTVAVSVADNVPLGNILAFDNGPVVVICPDAPRDTQSPLARTENPNFTKLHQYADLDALIEMWGHLRASNPDLDVYYRLASEVTADDLTTHVVLIGGVAWNAVSRRFQDAVRQVPITQRQVDDLKTGEIFEVGGPNEKEKPTQFYPTWDDFEHEQKELIEDVAFLARLRNPFNIRRALTICNGTHSHGVLGAVRCLTDKRVRDANEQFLAERFPDGQFALLLRVPVVANETLSPDLQNPDVRLYEWPITDGAAQ